MAFQSVPNTAQFNVHYLLDNQNCENVFCFEKPDGWNAFDLQATAELLQSWVIRDLMPSLAVELTFTRVAARDLELQFGPVYELANTPVTPGGNVSGVMPNENALCMSLRSAQAGRSERGRSYVPGIPRNKVTGNLVATDFADQMLLSYQGLLDTVEPESYSWVVVSRQRNGVVLPAGIPVPILSVILVDRVIDSQRRRKPGNGT